MKSRIKHIVSGQFVGLVWPMIVFFGVLLVTIVAGIYLVDFRDIFGIAVPRPQDEAPLYFVQNDYVDGLLALVGLALSFGLVFFLARKNHELTTLIAAFSLLYYGASVTLLASIHFRCTNLFRSEEASCVWPSFEAYHTDLFHVSARLFFLVVPVVILLGWGGAKMKSVFANRGTTAT